jgi:glycosyltransferase involved in cell wall biosynthesis
MTLPRLHIAVDLTPLLKGGANGGVKQYIYEVIPWLNRYFGEKIRFLFLTSSISHEEVRTALASSLDSIVCINKNSNHHVMEYQGRGDRDYFWNDPPGDFLWRLGVNLLYCPFGATVNHCPGIPTLATVVDLLHLDYLQGLNRDESLHRSNYFMHMTSTADAFQCISDYGVKRLSESYSVALESIFRTHLIIADRLVEPRRVQNKSNVPFFFYPANFWPHKNHATLVHALRLLKRKEVGLVFTGEGKNHNFVKDLVGKLGLEERVRFVGHVDDQELSRLYLSATGLVYASLSGPENLPPLEAMAAGCPVLNSDFPGAREQLGDAALFVPSLDPIAWAIAMEEVLKAARGGSIAARVGQGRRLVQIRTATSYVDGVLKWIEGFGATRSLWA